MEILRSDSNQKLPEYQEPNSIMTELVELLKEVMVFQTLGRESSEFIDYIKELVHFRYYKLGDTVCREGESAKAMFFIIRGQVSVISEAEDITFAELNAPGFFNRTATVRASTKCVLAVLLAEHLEATSQKYPEIHQAIKEQAETRFKDLFCEMNKSGRKLKNDTEERYVEMKRDISSGSLKEFKIARGSSRRNSELMLPPSPVDDHFKVGFTSNSLESICESGKLSKSEDILQIYSSKGALTDKHFDGLSYSVPSSPLCSFPSSATWDANNDVEISEQDDKLHKQLIQHPPQLQPNNTMKTLLKHGGLGPRRASVAVWSDDKLTQFAQNIQNKIKKESNLSTASTKLEETTLTTEIESNEMQVLKLVLKILPFQIVLHLRLISKAINNHIQLIPIYDLELSSFHKKINDTTLSSILTSFGTNLKKLNLKGCWSVTDKGLQAIANNCKDLQLLNLHSCWDCTDLGLVTLTNSCNNLVQVDLSNCRKLTDAGVLNLLSKCFNLREIELSYCKNLTQKIFDHQSWTRMKKINLQRCTAISDQAFERWNKLVEGKESSIDEISVSEENKEPEIRYHFDLNDLNLSDCSFLTDVAIEKFSNICPNLITINLSFCCGLTEKSVSHLINFCLKIKNFDLSFCGNACTDEILLAISKKKKILRSKK
ncbi:anaphase-promoting complex subunit Hcn1 [Lobulomyces angularis]|nr:anaphase-promoting complex subunit Hcn1 [Lobulomyces angularis]